MAQCLAPWDRKIFNRFTGWHVIQIPCGNCLNCLENKRLAWQFRLEQEFIGSKFSWFLSFTYAPEHLPVRICDDGLEHGYLEKSVLQNLVKRLREYCSRKYDATFRHYSCGEYGETDGLTHRPHYHIIMFTDSRDIYNNIDDICRVCWKYGRTDVTSVGGGTFGYMTMDIMKSFDKSLEKNFVENEYVVDWCHRLGIQKPFKLMSTKPFIGYKYLDMAENYHTSDRSKNSVVQLICGVKLPLPEIYRKKYFRNSYENAKWQLDQKAKAAEKYDKDMERLRLEYKDDIDKFGFERVLRMDAENRSLRNVTFSKLRTRKAKS